MMRLAFACLFLAAPVSAVAWATFDAPPSASLEWVAQDLVFNGVAMRIQFFRTKAAPAEVLAYYRQRWTEGGKRLYVENNLGPWRTISHASGDYFLTAQIRPAARGGAEGYLSQRPLKMAPRPILGQGFDLPSGSEVVNDILSQDGDRRGRTLLLFNNLSVDANATFFRGNLQQDGWTLVSEGRGRDGGRQLVLRRGSDELSLAMAAKGNRTAIGATLVRH
jgi:hypothetical protein